MRQRGGGSKMDANRSHCLLPAPVYVQPEPYCDIVRTQSSSPLSTPSYFLMLPFPNPHSVLCP